MPSYTRQGSISLSASSAVLGHARALPVRPNQCGSAARRAPLTSQRASPSDIDSYGRALTCGRRRFLERHSGGSSARVHTALCRALCHWQCVEAYRDIERSPFLSHFLRAQLARVGPACLTGAYARPENSQPVARIVPPPVTSATFPARAFSRKGVSMAAGDWCAWTLCKDAARLASPGGANPRVRTEQSPGLRVPSLDKSSEGIRKIPTAS